MKRSNIILIITLAVAIVLVGIYLLLFHVLDIFKDDTMDGTRDQADLTIVSYQEKDLSQITIINSTNTYIFTYSPDATLDFRWEMQHPTDFEAYPFYAHKYCSAILKIQATSIMENPDSDISVYGFDDPTARIKYGTAENVTEFLLGDSTPTGSGYYATADNGHHVYIVDNSIMESIDSFCVEKLASDYLFVSQKAMVQEAAFVREGELIWHLRRENRGEKSWFMIAPVSAQAEQNTIEDKLLIDIVNLQYQAVVESDCKDLAKYGLDKPKYELHVQEYGREPQILLLSQGEASGTGLLFGCYKGEDDVYTISQYDLGFLDISTFELVASVAYFAPLVELDSLEYRLGDKSYTITITGQEGEYQYALNGRPVEYAQIVDLYTSGVWVEADEVFLLSADSTDYLTITYRHRDGTDKVLNFRSVDEQGAQYLLYEDGINTGLLFYKTTLAPIVEAISALESGK